MTRTSSYMKVVFGQPVYMRNSRHSRVHWRISRNR